jgi:calcineurin-like phosphoesterase family protein
MNEKIISNWNSIIKEEDTVLFLGDFCFKNSPGGKDGEGVQTSASEWEKRLNGKIIFIKGNHDVNNSVKSCIKSMSINIGGKEIYLVHDPSEYNKEFKINLVGHVHDKWKIRVIDGVILVNVGVDVWDFKPIDIQDILNEIKHINVYKV